MKIFIHLLSAFVIALSFMHSAIAQGKVGINTTMPAAMLHVKDSNVVFTGPAAIPLPALPGEPPVSGAGVRLMWYPNKAAFRVGFVSGDYWDQENVGNFSFASGRNSLAKGTYSSASGTSGAYGDYSIALSNSIATGTYAASLGTSFASGFAATSTGSNTLASGDHSFATGWYARAIGDMSFALGANTRANGIMSIVSGFETKANPYTSMVIGQYNDSTFISQTSWELLDPVFIIGNGSADNLRSNAFTVLKNGNTGINLHNPQAPLHIKRGNPTNGPYFGNVISIYESTLNSYVQFANTNITEAGFLSGNDVTAIRSGLLFKADSAIHLLTGGNFANASLTQTGKLGVGTLSPLQKLHVVNGVSGGVASPNTVASFENNNNAYINIITPSANEGGMLFGQPSMGAHGGIIYNSASTSNGFQFRVNGNSCKMVMTSNGRLGINTLSPAAMFHVVVNNPTPGPYNGNVISVLESDQDSYLQFSNTNTKECGLLSGNEGTAIRSGLIFRSDSTIHLRTGGNISNVIIDKGGKVGIGNVTPGFPLNFPSVVGDKISLFGNSGNHYGLGIQNFLLQIHTSASTEDIAFGYGSSTSFTERMRIMGSGNVGIGTSSPSKKFHIVNGDSGATPTSASIAVIENNATNYLSLLTPNANASGIIFGNPSNNLAGGVFYNATISNGLLFTVGGNSLGMAITSNGQVGIGTISPSEKLHVVGDICYTGAIAACSDVRYKKNFRPISNALTSLQLIQGMYYDWNTEAFPDKEFNDERQIGFSAQELEKVYPEIVQTDPDGFKSVDYSRFTPILVEAIKEQQSQIDLLTNELNQLKEMILQIRKGCDQ